MIATIAGIIPLSAKAEIIKKEDFLHGVTTTREECAARQHTVWVNVHDRDFCVRYYLSTAGGSGQRPVIFLDGDAGGRIDSKSGTWVDPSVARDVDTEDLVRIADRFSQRAKTTAIFLARIGANGTSGNHLSRKTVLDLHLMNAALDAIKTRHKFDGFHLAGQSGGSKLAFGLAAMRSDLGCVVSGSGRLGTIRTRKQQVADPGQTHFDVMDSVQVLARKNELRLMMITDPADQAVPAEEQTPMARGLKQAGREIPQFFVAGAGPRHHSVVGYSVIAMAGCVLNHSDTDIAQAIEARVRRKVEIDRRGQN